MTKGMMVSAIRMGVTSTAGEWVGCHDFYLHHIISVLGALLVMISGRFCIPVSAGNLVSEFSNAAMNLRWRFLKHKMYDHFLFIPVSSIFMACFIASRGIFMLMLLIRNYEV